MRLDGRELVLGVTGSIAAYKAVVLLRELTRLGAGVTVCLTEHAHAFVGALTFRTLSGRPVLTDLFDPPCDAVSVLRPEHRKRLQYHQSQRALPNVCFVCHHLGFQQEANTSPVGKQKKSGLCRSVSSIRRQAYGNPFRLGR